MRRRPVLAGLGAAVAPLPLGAQPGKVHFILGTSTDAQPDPFIAGFQPQ
jgi:hypothetical protein